MSLDYLCFVLECQEDVSRVGPNPIFYGSGTREVNFKAEIDILGGPARAIVGAGERAW